MNLLRLAPDCDPRDATTLLFAVDGWTDAGRGSSLSSETLREQLDATALGSFDADLLFDYRDRRPLLEIDRGVLGELTWPDLVLYRIDPPFGRSLLLVTGSEPDFRWPALCDDLADLAEDFGITTYLGLGAVPGPVPHTRPTRVITTSSDPALFERYERPQEQVIVPASFQVVVEAALRDNGLTTIGLWARVPHYVATEYPAATIALLERLAEHTGVDLDLDVLRAEADEHRERLDQAAEGSPEVEAHIHALESAYDADVHQAMNGPLPTGDQIAAEFERFLRNRSE